ncbi:MAG TPA: hypothetical protein VFQ22_07995 [Longimicrobiales bacterium]|nr:hypothetical protein [Longimicrobiales bacterium]
MTRDERRHRGTLICQRLASEIAAMVPEGIGAWEPAWAIVAEADADFLAALSGWEADPSEASTQRVREAYQGVLDAWRAAAAEFERTRAGR